MKSPAVILTLGDAKWTLTIIASSGDRKQLELDPQPPEETGESLLKLLQQEKCSPSDMMVALPTSQCFAIPMEHDGPARRRSLESMTYELEPHLPWAAEEVVADFIPINASQSLAIAIRLEPIRSHIDSLEKAGFHVQWIVPTALLALQHVLRTLDKCDLLLWQQDGTVHLFDLQSRIPRNWLTASTDLELNQQLDPSLSAQRSESLQVKTIRLDPEIHLPQEFESRSQISEYSAMSMESAAEQTALLIARGESEPLVNLRISQLAPSDPYRQLRRPLNTVIACVIFFLISSLIAMTIRSSHYSALASKQESRQKEIYRQLYPSQQPPLDILSRLRSEHRRLKGLNGMHDDLRPEPSAIAILYSALSALPPDLRYRLLNITIENGKVLLDGEALSHGDAESIVTNLRQRGGLQVEPPRSENKADTGISFSITASTPSLAKEGATR